MEIILVDIDYFKLLQGFFVFSIYFHQIILIVYFHNKFYMIIFIFCDFFNTCKQIIYCKYMEILRSEGNLEILYFIRCFIV